MKILLVVIGLTLAYVEGQMYDRLYANLMKTDYSGTIPMRSADEPVVVKLGVSVINVKSIDTDTGDANIELWLPCSWTDGRLTWSKKKYNNINTIRVATDRVWTPDIEIYDGEMKSSKSLAILRKTGEFTHVPKTVVSVRCDLSNYTQDDTVTCSAKFGSWTYNGNEIDLQLRDQEADTNNFRSNRWGLKSSSLVRNEKVYPCCPEPYPHVTVTLVFQDNKQSDWSFF